MGIQIRDLRTQNRFFVDNLIYDSYGWIITPIGLAVYSALCRYADVEDQTCWPSHATIADRIGASETAVKLFLRLLKHLGLIDWESGKDASTSNTYVLLDPPAAPQGNEYEYPEWMKRKPATRGSRRETPTRVGGSRLPSRRETPTNNPHEQSSKEQNTGLTASTCGDEELPVVDQIVDWNVIDIEANEELPFPDTLSCTFCNEELIVNKKDPRCNHKAFYCPGCLRPVRVTWRERVMCEPITRPRERKFPISQVIPDCPPILSRVYATSKGVLVQLQDALSEDRDLMLNKLEWATDMHREHRFKAAEIVPMALIAFKAAPRYTEVLTDADAKHEASPARIAV